MFILVMISGCTNISLSPESTPTPPLSPENLYAVEMGFILTMIENHISGAEMNYYLLLEKPIGQTKYIPLDNNSNSTYRDLLRSLFIATGYPLVFSTFFSEEENLEEFRILAEASQAVLNSIFDIQVALGGVDVPISMSIPHREIESCMERVSSFHSLEIKILSGIIPTENEFSNIEENNCEKFDLSLMKIQQYIDEQMVN